MKAKIIRNGSIGKRNLAKPAAKVINIISPIIGKTFNITYNKCLSKKTLKSPKTNPNKIIKLKKISNQMITLTKLFLT